MCDLITESQERPLRERVVLRVTFNFSVARNR